MDQENNVSENKDTNSNKNKNILIIVGVAVVALVVVGYVFSGFWGRKVGENMAENILGDQLGGDVDIDSSDGSVSIKTDKGTFSAGTGSSWPSDMPSDIPKLTAGKITMSGSVAIGGTGWQVVASDVSENDFNSYHSSLKSNGWVDVGVIDFGLGIIQMTKGKTDLVITHNKEDNSFSLTVTLK